MNLPNYFLADLPREAALSPELLTEACQTLRRNRREYLARRSTRSLIQVFHDLSQNWLHDEFPFRKRALELGPAETGFSRATIAAGLDNFFTQLSGDSLQDLISQDLGHEQRLDDLVSTPTESKGQRVALARGPSLLLHICAGNIPNPALLSIVLGFLVRAAQVVKCASGTAFLPRLFAHSLYETEPKLGACLEVVEWPGGQEPLEAAIFGAADCVTATGSDETLASIRQRVPNEVRFLSYGHRISFGYIAQEVLDRFGLPKLAARAAEDVAAWNQLGCLSPHAFYVECGGRVSPEQFAEALSSELAKREEIEPRGAVSPETGGSIASRRAFYEVRAAHSPETRCWFSEQSTAWTVIYEANPLFQMSCLNRFIYVKSVANLTEALQGADAVRGQVSTVGLAAPEGRGRTIAAELARWGASRICPIGRMQKPPLTWRHDGRPSLAELVTWTDWEQ
ncbi:MAG: hypothetical protein HY735_27985 [Verrucomicrobia bacterium]|nr:hypothetical protein [Verrucomicrobiota bacterium]